MTKAKLAKHQRLLIGAAFVSFVLPLLGPLGWLLLPITYLNTHIHEFAHAVAAIGTGGQVGYIHVYGDGSGVTLSSGGFGPAIASAGYVGAAVVGGLLILSARTERSARTALVTAAIALACSMVLLVRSDMIGVLTGIGWVGVLSVAARRLGGNALIFAVQFLGIQQCMESLDSVWTLLRISRMGADASDAQNMAQMTAIPAIVWATIWAFSSIGILVMCLARSWNARA